MKNLLIVLLAFGSAVYGQTANNDMIVFTSYQMPKTIYATDALNLYHVKGSPYLNSSFTEGKIVDTEKNNFQKANLRYNFLHDVIEVQIESEKNPVVLSKLKNIEYLIGEEKFYHSSFRTENNEVVEGYFNELFAGNNLKFLVKYKADYTSPRIAVTGYERNKPGKISLHKDYFIQKDNGNLKELKLNKRNIHMFFNDEKASEYLNDHEIKSKNDVIDFLRFYTE